MSRHHPLGPTVVLPSANSPCFTEFEEKEEATSDWKSDSELVKLRFVNVRWK